MNDPYPINGLVLAGGRSKRMGTDKGEITFHKRPQREHVFELLRLFCDHVFTSCRRDQALAESLHPLYDSFGMETPLNGILSAFATNTGVAWLTLPIDMPLVQKDDIGYLLSKRDSSKVATCFYDSNGISPEPLFAIWEPRASPLLLKFAEGGGVSPRDFLHESDISLVDILDTKALTNVNTMEEWAAMSKSKSRL